MAPRSEDPKLIIRVITFELVQPVCPRYIKVTDRRTYGRTTYDSNTALALRALRGKNAFNIHKIPLLTISFGFFSASIPVPQGTDIKFMQLHQAVRCQFRTGKSQP